MLSLIVEACSIETQSIIVVCPRYT